MTWTSAWRVWGRTVRCAALVCLLLPVTVACGETNTYNQQAGRDGKLCADGAVCTEPSRDSDTPVSPSSTPSARGGAEGPSREERTADDEPPTGSEQWPSTGTTPEPRSDVRVRYLTEVKPIGGYGNNEQDKPAVLGDTAVPRSIVFALGVFAKELKPLSFNVPTGLTGLRAKVGLDGDTLPEYVAQVSIRARDGSTLSSLTLRSGEVHDVKEDVSGASLITVEVAILEWAPDAINSRPHIVLGDGRFVE
ncbi:hypothetical protein [Streptomyces sp. CAI-85]|uniref:hypothetical protein n=1 Tax=Streptomyces sp. CAI-85 TaxID=1472662 RepID=UPI0015870B31|nr:hypothetical protein [Streptomyces sp. CAI-85]NUV58809.1 hypothetical protein [Streptomyces sp. CAI-85]